MRADSPQPPHLAHTICTNLHSDTVRVGTKPGFYHKAQPGGFYGFMRAGFGDFMGCTGFF